ncbi:MAG: protein translocase subunit SecD [Planctomycetota bacterium]
MFRHSMTRILITVVAVALATVAWLVYGIPKGTDLLGGVELRFKIKTQEAPTSTTQPAGEVAGHGFDTAEVINILRQRADPTGTRNVEIQQIGANRMRVEIPGVEDEELRNIIERLTTIGRLEFKLDEDDPDLRRRAEQGDVPPGYLKLERFEADPHDPSQKRLTEWVLVKKEDPLVLTGDGLKNVFRDTDEFGRPAVGFSWKPKSAIEFSELTGRHVRRRLAIILDGQLHSAPVIRSRISDRGVITGGDAGFSQSERDNLLYVLQSGSLPVSLDLEGKSYVGASLGEDSIRRGLAATIISVVLVMVFMAVYYLLSGLIANFVLMLNLVLICGALSLFRATLTLPGIAGLALTLGMAVDANVLIFERIREEKDRGRALSLAIKNGFDRAWSAILDSNLTTIITAVILYVVGTAAVRGFAVTLAIGLVLSMFTAVYVARGIFQVLLDGRIARELRMNRLFHRTQIDFVSKMLPAMIVSGVLIVAGIVLFLRRGTNNLYDTDFVGGYSVQLALKRELPIAEVRKRLAEGGLPGVQVSTRQGDANALGRASSTEFGLRASPQVVEECRTANASGSEAFEEIVRRLFEDDIDVQEVKVADIQLEKLPEPGPNATDPYLGFYRIAISFDKDLRRDFFVRGLTKAGFDGIYDFDELPSEASKTLATSYTIKLRERDVDKIKRQFENAFSAPIYFKHVEYVGAVVAEEMKTKALWAVFWSWLAIIVYVSIRFRRLSYGLASVAALVHDVLISMAAIAFFNWITLEHPALDFLKVGELRIDLTVVAAVLTIVGYSINDTIVIFDRIRENLAGKPRLTPTIVNDAVNQTLARTFLTSLTVLLALLALYLLGGQRIHSFSIVMLVGVVSGTYSTIFIAAPLLLSPKEWLWKKNAQEKP